MRISGQHAIDFLDLPRTEIFVRIETPPSGEQTLPPEHFVDSCDAPRELVGGIEERRVGVHQLRAERRQRPNIFTRRLATPAMEFDSSLLSGRPRSTHPHS